MYGGTLLIPLPTNQYKRVRWGTHFVQAMVTYNIKISEMKINSHIIPLEALEGKEGLWQVDNMATLAILTWWRVMISRTASICVKPRHGNGFTNRCDGTTPRFILVKTLCGSISRNECQNETVSS